jgi:hypothetical protein
MLERGSAHRGTTKAQARIITAAARALLDHGYIPPLYTKGETRVINANARALLARGKKKL